MNRRLDPPPEPGDIEIPGPLATMVREAAAAVPATAHDLGRVQQRARRQQRRWSTGVAVGSVAAAVAVLLGAIGVVQGLSPDDEADVTIPGGPAAGEAIRVRQGGVAVLAPPSLPAGWTLSSLDISSTPGALPDTTTQLFAVDGPSPLPRGVVVSSSVTDHEAGDGAENGTVRGLPALVGPFVVSGADGADDGADGGVDEGPAAIQAEWVEDGVGHWAVARGLSEAELLAFLDSLAARDEPASGFDAPVGTALPELDAVTVRDPQAPFVGYEGPAGRAIGITAQRPGWTGGLLHRLVGRPRGDGLVVDATAAAEHPSVSVARADGWTVDVMATDGEVDPALLDTIATGVEPLAMQELVDRGLAGPVTTRVTVDARTVEVHGTGDAATALCLTTAVGDEVCTGVVHPEDSGFSSASLVVDGDWLVVTVAEGDEAGTVHPEPDGGWPRDEDYDATSGETLSGDRTRSDGHTVEIVTVPATTTEVQVFSPATPTGRHGLSYARPTLTP